ncbi:MAG: hypothetical protein Q4D34_01785 [Eggerthellaceae bacterium]|nr:hypothetical protein [Eggerthellaceae bacterium]
MAKRVGPSEMIEFHTEEAEELMNETRYGLGTPIEARIANAIRENADNIAAQNKGMSKYIQKMSETQKEIDEISSKYACTAERFDELCDLAKKLSNQFDVDKYDARTLADDVATRIVASVDPVVRRAVESSVERSIGEVDRKSGKQLSDVAEKFDKELDLNESRMESISKKIRDTLEEARWRTIGLGMRVALIIALALSVVASVSSCAVIKPVVAGEAKIVYTD